jgi:hypothetical protein
MSAAKGEATRGARLKKIQKDELRVMELDEIDARPFWEICDQACDVCEETDCPYIEDLKADLDDNDETS